MFARRMWSALLAATFTTVVCLSAAAIADAAGAEWNGRYHIVTFASDKMGTSLAAAQREPDFSASYVLSSDCTSGLCVATVVEGPAPSNPTIPQPVRYTWDGSRWQYAYNWQWRVLPRRRGAQRIFPGAVQGVLCPRYRRLDVRHLAHRHPHWSMPRQRHHARRSVPRLAPTFGQRPQEERQVRGPLGEPAHEVAVPLRAERHVDPDMVARRRPAAAARRRGCRRASGTRNRLRRGRSRAPAPAPRR